MIDLITYFWKKRLKKIRYMLSSSLLEEVNKDFKWQMDLFLQKASKDQVPYIKLLNVAWFDRRESCNPGVSLRLCECFSMAVAPRFKSLHVERLRRL